MIKPAIAVLALATAASALGAQQPVPIQERVAEFKQMLAVNQQARHNFTWLETTQVAYEGVVKMTKLSDCQFAGGSPRPTCTELSLQQAPLSGGFIRRRIEEKKADELKTYMYGVRTLIGEYVPPRPAALDAAYQAGRLSVAPDPAAGTTRLVVTNYLKAGDNVSITYNTASKKLVRAEITTWLNSATDTVTFTVTFATLPNGVFYAYQKVLSAPSQSVTVTITSSDFSEAIAP